MPKKRRDLNAGIKCARCGSEGVAIQRRASIQFIPAKIIRARTGAGQALMLQRQEHRDPVQQPGRQMRVKKFEAKPETTT
jgi:hypothetical protein